VSSSVPVQHKMIVEKIDSLPSLLALEAEWRLLEAHARQPFASWDWTVAWWTQLREDKLGVKDSMFVRAIRSDAGELLAVAPLLISRRPSVGPICVRQLQFFGADPNITELRGLVAQPGCREGAYRALLAHVCESADEWDSMLLTGIPPDLDLGALSDVLEFEWQEQTLNYELQLPASWEEFRSALPRNMKESLRKCYNAPKRDNRELRLEVVQEEKEVGPTLQRFFALHGARARRTDTVRHANPFETSEAQRFLIEVCQRFARRGGLRVFQLLVDGQVVALRIGFVTNDTLYLYYSGYNADFGKYSVMTTLVAEAIKYAIAQGMKSVNLSTGNDVSKARWRPVELVTRQALVISPRKRAEIAHQVYKHALSAIGNVPALRRAVSFLARRSLSSAC
jgi:CelD/BcsL family acetyltransferase involved in cellulose biosynthesis